MIVVDSNLWISALVFGGNPRKVFERIVHEGHSLVVSEAILTEIRRILHKKFKSFITDFEDLLVVLQPRLKAVQLGGITVDICRDVNDNMVIETAVIGKASLIVSGDKDLLDLKKYHRVAFVTAIEFLKS